MLCIILKKKNISKYISVKKETYQNLEVAIIII